MSPYRGYGTPPCPPKESWLSYHNSFQGGIIIGLTLPLFLLWPIFFLEHTWDIKSRKCDWLDWGLFFFLVFPLLQWFFVWSAWDLKGPGAYRFRHPLLRYDPEVL
jgi:hypothetical protein